MIAEGTSGSVSLTVGVVDTAVALGSGDVHVLGTPRIVALCEEAAVVALAGLLPDGSTSVGTNINIDHLAATPVGRTVDAVASVTTVDRRRIVLSLLVMDGESVAARGAHTRVIVNREEFEAALLTPES